MRKRVEKKAAELAASGAVVEVRDARVFLVRGERGEYLVASAPVNGVPAMSCTCGAGRHPNTVCSHRVAVAKLHGAKLHGALGVTIPAGLGRWTVELRREVVEVGTLPYLAASQVDALRFGAAVANLAPDAFHVKRSVERETIRAWPIDGDTSAPRAGRTEGAKHA